MTDSGPRQQAIAIGEAVYRDFLIGNIDHDQGEYEGERCAIEAAARALAQTATRHPVCDQCNGYGYLLVAASTCSAGGEHMRCDKCQPVVFATVHPAGAAQYYKPEPILWNVGNAGAAPLISTGKIRDRIPASPPPLPSPNEVRESDGALRSLVASVLPVGDNRAPDDKVIPFYVTMREIRAIRAALGRAGAASA